MRGLLEKDIRLTLSRKRTLVIFVAVAVVMGFSTDESFIIAYFTMLAMIVATGTISYDEFDNGMAFLMTLPVDRKTYVIEKYLFSLMMSSGAWCVVACFCFIMDMAKGNEIDFTLVVIVPVLFLLTAVMIPLQLKYGAEKSRVVLLIIFGIIAAAAFYARLWVAGIVETIGSMPETMIILVMILLCVIISFASLKWSVRIMEKKEF